MLPFMENSIMCKLTRSLVLGNGGDREERGKGRQGPWNTAGARDVFTLTCVRTAELGIFIVHAELCVKGTSRELV